MSRFEFHPQWNGMSRDEQLDAISEHANRLAADGYPTGSRFDSTKPEWMPSTNAIRNNLFCDWTAIMAGVGIPPLDRHVGRKSVETECQCGKPIEALRYVEVLLGYHKPTVTLLPMCGECAELWDSELA